MSVILGVNCMSHDTSACLIIDGQVVSLVEKERLYRQEHTDQFPYSAINSCLNIAGVTDKGVNIISYSHKSPPTSFLQDKFREPTNENAIDIKWWLDLTCKSRKPHQFFDNIHNLIYAGYHESHAASTFFVSPFNQALILLTDGLVMICQHCLLWGVIIELIL
jgi:carbamoyltransferase